MNAPPSDNPYRAPVEAEFAERGPPAVTLAMVLWLWFFSALCGLGLVRMLTLPVAPQCEGEYLIGVVAAAALTLFFAACARAAMSVRNRRRPSA